MYIKPCFEPKFKMHQDELPANTRVAIAELEKSGRQDLADAMRHYNDIQPTEALL